MSCDLAVLAAATRCARLLKRLLQFCGRSSTTARISICNLSDAEPDSAFKRHQRESHQLKGEEGESWGDLFLQSTLASVDAGDVRPGSFEPSEKSISLHRRQAKNRAGRIGGKSREQPIACQVRELGRGLGFLARRLSHCPIATGWHFCLIANGLAEIVEPFSIHQTERRSCCRGLPETAA